MIKITEKEELAPGIWGMPCPRCGTSLQCSSTKKGLPELAYCDCESWLKTTQSYDLDKANKENN